MTDLAEFVNSRDEWHYWWVGFAAGWTLALAIREIFD